MLGKFCLGKGLILFFFLDNELQVSIDAAVKEIYFLYCLKLIKELSLTCKTRHTYSNVIHTFFVWRQFSCHYLSLM